MSEVTRMDLQKDPAKQADSGNAAHGVSSHKPPGSPVSRILRFQQTAGNSAVQKMLKSDAIQASLRIGQPNDIYEKEADRVADEVMRMPEPAVQRGCSPGSACPLKDDDEKKTVVLRKPGGAPHGSTSVPDSFVSSLGSGQPLDMATRSFFEPRLGADFRDVRVHTGSRAEESAREISARAFTYGTDIVFGKNQFAPTSPEGRRLLAHELAHVIQQGGAEAGLHRYRTSRQARRKLNTDPLIQRAPCPCCATSIAIGNISKIDNTTHMGHSFDVNIGLSYPASGSTGSCALEWWEKISVPAISGHQANVWTEMYGFYSISPTFDPWKNRVETCNSSQSVTITDPPALGKTPHRTVTRTLEFRIKVNSKPDTGSGCTDASKEVTAKQVLKMVDAVPKWDESSFTTP